MAWHTVSQAQKMVGKSRRTLYRDMASGLVSYRTSAKGHRELETSELMRHYGELNTGVTVERPIVAQQDGTQREAVLLDEIRLLRHEVAELKGMMLRLEHKAETVKEKSPASWWRFWRR